MKTAALLLGLVSAGSLACEPALRGANAHRVEGSRYVVAWRASGPIKVSEFFELEVAACARAGAAPNELRVDAQMPEHRHGVNYRPAVAMRGEGRFVASGLLLHMPGRWEFTFDLRGAGGAETLRTQLAVP